jgi:hypothetical protein
MLPIIIAATSISEVLLITIVAMQSTHPFPNTSSHHFPKYFLSKYLITSLSKVLPITIVVSESTHLAKE